jgi:ADP-ribose pyrophosphatase YjhB (NUDIX family)
MSENPNYCPDCGTALEGRRIEGRERRYCDGCERPVYRNPKPCSGVLVVDGRDRTLLVKRTDPPAAGSWSVPAGYLEADEPAPAAAIRELGEETGLTTTAGELTLLETTLVRHPDGRHVLVVIYVVSASETSGVVTAGSDAAAARFWDLSKLRSGAAAIEPGYDPILERAIEAADAR